MSNATPRQEVFADTTIVGDVDAFMAYVESGQAVEEWYKRHAEALQEFERMFRTNQRAYRHIVSDQGHVSAPGSDTPIPV